MFTMHKKALSVIALSILLIPGGCARKARMDHGVVTFKIGQVSVQRSASGQVELATGDRIMTGDVLTTGEHSAAAIQFSERCVIRVDERTTFRIIRIEDMNLEMFVSEGSVMSKLVRKEDMKLEIMTRTALAAVRGTEFSVTYKDGQSTVAVSKGQVDTAAVRHDDTGKKLAKVEKEVPVAAGKTVEVIERPATGKEGHGSLSVNLREISDEEKNSLRKIHVIPIIEEPEKKSREELDQIRNSVIEIENEIDGSQNQEVRKEMAQDQVRALLMKKNRTMEDIRKTFNRIDEISLYNGKVIRGAIMSRGAEDFRIITPERTMTVPKKDIMSMKVIK